MEKEMIKMMKLLLIKLDIEAEKQNVIINNIQRFYDHENKIQKEKRDIQF